MSNFCTHAENEKSFFTRLQYDVNNKHFLLLLAGVQRTFLLFWTVYRLLWFALLHHTLSVSICHEHMFNKQQQKYLSFTCLFQSSRYKTYMQPALPLLHCGGAQLLFLWLGGGITGWLVDIGESLAKIQQLHTVCVASVSTGNLSSPVPVLLQRETICHVSLSTWFSFLPLTFWPGVKKVACKTREFVICQVDWHTAAFLPGHKCRKMFFKLYLVECTPI